MTGAKRLWPGPDVAPYKPHPVAWDSSDPVVDELMEFVDRSAWRGRETAPGGGSWTPAEWRPNNPFRAVLRLEGMQRGRSAARFVWSDTDTGIIYPMFMTDAVDLMASRHGVVYGVSNYPWWIVVKRGQNFGLAPLDEMLWGAAQEATR